MTREQLARLSPVVLSAVFIVTACEPSATEPPPTLGPAEVQVTPETLILPNPGTSEQLSATVKDDAGSEIRGAPVAWSSSDESVAAVDREGWVEAVSQGTATISAVAGNVEGMAQIIVESED